MDVLLIYLFVCEHVAYVQTKNMMNQTMMMLVVLNM